MSIETHIALIIIMYTIGFWIGYLTGRDIS